MKSSYVAAFVVSILSGCLQNPSSAQESLRRLAGPPEPAAILYSNNSGELYAATRGSDVLPVGRVYVFNRDEASWTETNLSFCCLVPSAIAEGTSSALIVGGRAVESGKLGTVLISDEARTEWVHVASFDYPVTSVLVVEDGLFAATTGGLFHSNDGGMSWTSAEPRGIAVNSIRLLNGTVIAATEGGVYRSLDKGSSWELTLRSPAYTLLWDSDDRLYAGGHGIFYSDDHGQTWIGPQLDDHDIQLLSESSDGSLFLVAANQSDFPQNTIFQSHDDGLSWSPIDSVAGEILSMTNAPGFGLLLALQDKIVLFRSGELQPFGLPSANVVEIDNDEPGSLYVATPTRLYASSDQGRSWRLLLQGIELTDLLVSRTDLIFVASSTQLMRSQDFGRTWQIVYEEPHSSRLHTIIEGPDAALILGSEKAVARSIDDGESWTLIGDDFSDIVLSIASDALHIYAAVGNDILSLSIGDHLWQTLASNISADPISDLYVGNTGYLFAIAGGTLIRSADGANWEPLLEGVATAHITDSGEILSAPSFGGVWQSNNGGDSWERLASAQDFSLVQPPPVVQVIKTLDGSAYFGTQGFGLYSSGLIPAFVDDVVGTHTSSQSLSVFPIPAFASATVQFEALYSGEFLLSMFDLLGRRVVAVQGITSSRTKMRQIIDTSSFLSGVYLIRVDLPGGTAYMAKLLIAR